MAYDIARRKEVGRDWSIGAELPKIAKGYHPRTWWTKEEMLKKLSEIENTQRGFFIKSKPSKAEAMELLIAHMRDRRIGPMEGQKMSGVGSILFSKGEQQALFNKIDDVRYDVRRAKAVVGGSVFALSGALALIAVALFARRGTRQAP